MLVVMAIIIVITGVIFTGQSSFSNTVILTSTAYDVALTMRDAETYGLGTRAQGGISNAAYGLDFRLATPRTYTLFADSFPPAGSPTACHALPPNGASAPNAYPGDCVYGSGDGIVSTYTLGNGVSFSKFCASSNNGVSWSCSSDAHSPLAQLDLVFQRPNAVPFISENGVYTALPGVTNVCLALSSGSGTRFISVSSSGEITASAASCP